MIRLLEEDNLPLQELFPIELIYVYIDGQKMTPENGGAIISHSESEISTRILSREWDLVFKPV